VRWPAATRPDLGGPGARIMERGEAGDTGVFAEFPPERATDIPLSEQEALQLIFSATAGHAWKRRDTWQHGDAAQWEGVAVTGGEEAQAVLEEHLVPSLAPGLRDPSGSRPQTGAGSRPQSGVGSRPNSRAETPSSSRPGTAGSPHQGRTPRSARSTGSVSTTMEWNSATATSARPLRKGDPRFSADDSVMAASGAWDQSYPASPPLRTYRPVGPFLPMHSMHSSNSSATHPGHVFFHPDAFNASFCSQHATSLPSSGPTPAPTIRVQVSTRRKRTSQGRCDADIHQESSLPELSRGASSHSILASSAPEEKQRGGPTGTQPTTRAGPGASVGERDGEFLREAKITHVHVRGKGTNQRVEYDLRYLDGTVTRLDLAFNGLSGSFPHGIPARLPFLEYLSLEGNQLSGELDIDLLRLRLEERITLVLADVQPGFSLPTDLSIMGTSRLAVVDLSGCSLVGPLPESIGTLTTIQRLVLDDNRLSGPLPSALSQLLDLTLLSVERNNFSGPLPPELFHLHRTLQILRLAGNDFHGPLPCEWMNLSSLLELTLYDNPKIELFPFECDPEEALPGCSVVR